MSDNPYVAPKSDTPSPLVTARLSKRVAWIDALASAFFSLLFFAMLHIARLAAEEAVRLYGRNVDSGALESAVAVLYCAPAAIAFTVASIAVFRGWRFHKVLHGLAWAWAALPLVFVAFDELRRAAA
jgi:hypothetical protein